MTDLEITRLCAEAMGIPYLGADNSLFPQAIVAKEPSLHVYSPLHDDAQAMALEDWLIERGFLKQEKDMWQFQDWETLFIFEVEGPITPPVRRRAICECVAKMQAAKK